MVCDELGFYEFSSTKHCLGLSKEYSSLARAIASACLMLGDFEGAKEWLCIPKSVTEILRASPHEDTFRSEVLSALAPDRVDLAVQRLISLQTSVLLQSKSLKSLSIDEGMGSSFGANVDVGLICVLCGR